MSRRKRDHIKALEIIIEHEIRGWIIRAIKEEIHQIKK